MTEEKEKKPVMTPIENKENQLLKLKKLIKESQNLSIKKMKTWEGVLAAIEKELKQLK